MTSGRRSVAWVVGAVAMFLSGPVAQAGAPAYLPAYSVTTDDWASKAWAAAHRGDTAALDQILKAAPESLNADSILAKSIKTLLANVKAREDKRVDDIARVRKELAKVLAVDGTDLSLSAGLRQAVELSMLSIDKPALLEEAQIRTLIADADAAARKAEARGDWMMASELYYRLDLLLEERGTYRDDVKRESQRLGMIRLYAPKRLWDLKNARRTAEIEWRAKLPKEPKVEGKDGKDKPDEASPLPPYNPMGDDYHDKLKGIDESMVIRSLNRGFERHVERTPMDKILKGGIDAVRTLVKTDDLKAVFPGLGDETKRTAFLGSLDSEEQRLQNLGHEPGAADLYGTVQRLVTQNEKTINISREAMLHEFGNGGTSALDDFTAVVWPDEVPRFERNTQGRFVGVGVQIELDPLQNIRIVTPLDSTPAQRAGIRSGDLIKKVNGVSTIGFTLDQAVDVITGQEDSQVTLTIERELRQPEGGNKREEVDYKLTRSRIEVVTVKGWRKTGTKEEDWDWFVDPANGIGYVRVTQFADRTDAEFDRAIDVMKRRGLNGIILDLRYNPGGLLDQAVAIVSRFVDRNVRSHGGLVVTTHAKDNALVQRERVEEGRARLAGIPIVVLVNQGSASASEIVSGALQDYAKSGDIKAVVLGERSYGKGSVQNVWPLERAGTRAYIKVTTQYYRLPDGRMIHRRPTSTTWGVDPDLTVDMLPTQISDALTLRLNADVLKVDEKGKPIAGDTEASANPDDLIIKGIDLQLEQALVLLQSQVPAAVAGSGAVKNGERNN